MHEDNTIEPLQTFGLFLTRFPGPSLSRNSDERKDYNPGLDLVSQNPRCRWSYSVVTYSCVSPCGCGNTASAYTGWNDSLYIPLADVVARRECSHI